MMPNTNERYRVSFTRRDGSVDIHEHLTYAETLEIGLTQAWDTIERVEIEREEC